MLPRSIAPKRLSDIALTASHIQTEMIGKTISHFRIDEKLGQGGMGIVYRAHDTKLNRKVALKFLPAHLSGDAEAKARFIQEAQSASGLDHPNICTIYDIGETPEGELFIAMAYYTGKTLKYAMSGGGLGVEGATDVAVQIARALGRAHEAGIVHRDVKPANIMLTERNEIKLLDFGLAKLVGGNELTKMGSTVGTAAYMSPEQMRGDEITSAADVWSLGALFYELLSGEKPFKGEYDQALMYGILNETPILISDLHSDIPEPIARIVSRCLEKTPALRPTISEFLKELGESSGSNVRAATTDSAVRHSGPAPETSSESGVVPSPSSASGSAAKKGAMVAVAAILAVLAFVLWPSGGDSETDTGSATGQSIDRSVAVLPFSVRSVEEGSDATVLAGGIHDDLLSQLAKIEDLRVISRTSVLQYEGSTKSVSEIAAELGVATVLEGTLQRAGDRIRVNVSLIDARTDAQLWNDTYDQELTTANIFAIQTDLAHEIAKALDASLSPAQEATLASNPQVSMEAYDLYTQSMYKYLQGAFGVYAVESAELMRQVLEIEPDYARAHASLARMYIDGVRNSFMDDDVMEDARYHVARALEIDPLLPDAHIEKSAISILDLDYASAETEIQRAMELAPGDARPHGAYATLLYTLGRPNEAVESARRAVELDPLDVETRGRLADVYFFIEDYEGSLAESQKVLQMDPEHSSSYYNIGYCYAMMGRMDESINAFERSVELEGNDVLMRMGLAWAHAKAGNASEALSLISNVEDNPTMLREKAIIYGILGDLDTAFALLDRAFEMNPGVVAIIGGDSSVTPEMRADPRFVNLMEKLGLRQ